MAVLLFTAKKVAENEGVGNFSSLEIGLGMIGGVASAVGNMTNEVVKQTDEKKTL